MDSIIKPYGEIDIEIKWKDGKTENRTIKNKILRTGRIDLASAIANTFGGTYDFFVTSMQFGSGGTVGGTPRFVDDTIEGLFGPVIITKGVISSIPSTMPTQAIFTSVLTFSEAVGQNVNEMALVFYNGDVFSMATFGDIAKTSSMELVFNWRITMI